MTGNNLCHSIRKQNFEVEFYGTESEGLSLQRSLPFFCHNRLIPAIEDALNRYAPANACLSIDRLDIDAGSVSLDRLEHELPRMVDRALEKYFQALPQTDGLTNTPENAHIQRKTIQQTIIAAFIFFLKNGTLPWSFHLPSGSGFDELIMNSLKETEVQGSSHELIKNEVIETLASATARTRLIQQFTPALHETVVELISTEGRKVVKGIVSLLYRSDAALIDKKKLEQEVWECAFTCIASGNTLTETYLRRETRALATAFGVFPTPTSPSQQSEETDKTHQVVYDQNKEPRRKQRGILKTTLSYFTPQEAGNITHRDSRTSEKKKQSHSAIGNNDQAEHRSEPASSTRQSESSDEEENEASHQIANAKKSVLLSAIEHPDAKTGIYTGLAGLVLLHPFLPQLFRALNIADDEKLLQPDRAIYLLHFLATGSTDAKEYELVIPKMLCHSPFERAVESNISLADADQEEAIALLAAVIRHWEVLKNTGTDGLRETFLKRSGKLSLLNNGEWLLQVESNACDILLEQLPWGISMIKLPWMHEMLRVEWV